MLNPFRSGFYAIQLLSHKLLRYAVPVFLILIFASSAALAFSSKIFAFIFALQIVFYAMAVTGWLLERRGKGASSFSIPLYFVLTNLASLIAFYKFLRGQTYANWEPIREPQEKNPGLQASFIAFWVASCFASVAYYWFIYYLIAYAIAFRRIYKIENNLSEELQAEPLWKRQTA
jgi:signal transduction histidine kinase